MRRVLCLGAVALVPATTVRAGGLDVDACVRLALARAPSAQAAASQMEAATAGVRAAKAAYWPRLTGQTQYGSAVGYDAQITNGGVTAFGIGVDTALLDGGQRSALLAAARARLQSAAAIEQQRRADVTFAVRSAYFAALAGRAEAAIAADAVAALTDYLTLLERQEGIGLVPRGDVPRAQLAVETAHASARSTAAALQASRHELSTLIGAAVDAAELVEPPAPTVGPIDRSAIEASPVVVDARATAEAAHRDADAVRSEGRIHVRLTADAGFLGVDPVRTFRDNGGGEFLLGATLPLFDGGAINARSTAAIATATAADAAVDEARQTLAIALERARSEAERASADARAWRRAQPAAADAFLLMRGRYFGGGSVRLLDVLDALTQSVDARRAVVLADLAYQLAAATQDQILGRSPQ